MQKHSSHATQTCPSAHGSDWTEDLRASLGAALHSCSAWTLSAILGETVQYLQSSSSSFHHSSILPHPIQKWIPKTESRLLKLHCHPWHKPFLQSSAPWPLLFLKSTPTEAVMGPCSALLGTGHIGNLCPQGACNPNCNSAIPPRH